MGATPGAGPGQFSHPFYLALDCRGSVYVSDRDNHRIQRLGLPGAPTCGDPAADATERLRLTARAAARQRFRRDFAVLAQAACDRPCTIAVTGSVRVAGRRRALKLRRVEKVIDGTAPLDVRVAPGERDTDRLLAALRRHRRAVASLRVAAVDLRGQRAAASLRARLR